MGFSSEVFLGSEYLGERLRFVEEYFSWEGVPLRDVLYDYQRGFLLDGSRFRLVNKSRQTGFSWVAGAEALGDSFLNSRHVTLLISTGIEGSKRLNGYVSDFYHGLPVEWRRNIRLVENSKTTLKLANGSYVVSLPNSPTAVRGYPANHVVLDEFAHIERDGDIYSSILPTIIRGGRLSVLSTPFGNLNLFSKFWNKPEHSYFSKHLVPWSRCPHLTAESIAEIRKSLSDEEFFQEFECRFVDEASSVFPYDLLRRSVDVSIDHFSLSGFNKELPISIGVDFGKKESFTTIHVGQKSERGFELRFVKTFKPNVEDVDLNYYSDQIDYIVHLGEMLKPVSVNVDRTGVGEKLYEDLRARLGGVVEGVIFSAPMKERLVGRLILAFKDGLMRIPNDNEIIEHLHNIKLNTRSSFSRFVTPKGKRDDHAWALALMVLGLDKARIFWGIR